MRHAVDDLEREGLLAPPQAALLRRVYARRLISVSWELRGLLYLGVLVLVAGLGLWLRENLTSLGHALLIGGIGAVAAGCLAYCLRRGGGFTAAAVPSTDAAFDYVLFLGCLLFGTDLAYFEVRYGLLGRWWDLHLLGSGLLYLVLAHYFDQRLVLSLALSTLGAWLGVKTALLGSGALLGTHRADALAFGAATVAAGVLQSLAGWKRHFLPVHLHLGANVLLAGLVSGVFESDARGTYLAAVLAAAGALGAYAARSRRFAYLLYAFAYGYVGASSYLLRALRPDFRVAALYLLLSSGTAAAALWWLHRRLGSER